jgi:hypothetical protein
VHQIVVKKAARQSFRTSRGGALSNPHGHHTRGQQQHVSRLRAGNASDVIANLGPIQNDESRVNIRFGSGGMTKSPPWCIRRTSELSAALSAAAPNSVNVIPATKT